MNIATISTMELWRQREGEARKHAVSRVVQLYLDKRYFVAIEATGHTGKPQDFIKESILNEAQRRFNAECMTTKQNESDKERAERLQAELIATETKLNDTLATTQTKLANTEAELIAAQNKLNDILQAMQKVCSSISI